jgi:hypothetical protein
MKITEIKPDVKYVVDGYRGYWVAKKVDLARGLVLCERRDLTNPNTFVGNRGAKNKPLERIFKIEQIRSTYNTSTETL